MYSNEIIPQDIERYSGLQVHQLLREGVGRAGEPAKLHPHSKIAPLHVGGRDSIWVRLPDPLMCGDADNLLILEVSMARILERLVDFQGLREVDVCSKVFFYRIEIISQAIGRELEAPFCAVLEIPSLLSG